MKRLARLLGENFVEDDRGFELAIGTLLVMLFSVVLVLLQQ